jgi:hypothetical protein
MSNTKTAFPILTSRIPGVYVASCPPRAGRSRIRREKMRVAVVFLFCVAFSLGACEFIDRAKIRQEILPAPVQMNMITLFDQYEQSIRIDASAGKVWSTFTDPEKTVRILSEFETLIFSPDAGAAFRLGTHFGYETLIAGLKTTGSGVVTNFSPGSFLTFAFLEPRRNITTVTLQENPEGKTVATIHMTQESLPQNMAVTSYDIRASIDSSLRKTLKNLKRFSENVEPSASGPQQVRVEFRSQGLEPFEIIDVQDVLPVGMETINRFFLEEDAYETVLARLKLQVSVNLVHMMELPGIGVPFAGQIGPIPLDGIILVTDVVPDRVLDLSTFYSRVSLIQGGANLRFFARGEKQTEMRLVQYFQIPDEYECHAVDKEQVKAGMEKSAAELVHLTEWITEKRPPRALLEKRPRS